MSGEDQEVGAQDNDEFAAAFVHHLGRTPVRDLVIQALATLIDAAGIRLGLGPEGDEVVDIVQARVAIEMVRWIVVVAEQELGVASVRPFREPLAQLQLAYAKIAERPDGVSPEGPADTGSRRLWVPGE